MIERNLTVKIPLERVGVLIGSDGGVKATIEKKFRIGMSIDSETGDISLKSSEIDPSILFRARDLIIAIGRGFSPERAFNLLNEEMILFIIDLRELFESPSEVQRVKSRIIGRNGKTRRIIEEETMTCISIYGHTVSIIGDVEHLEIAREAVKMLIRGILHRNVYKYLERKRSELRESEMEIWKSTPTILETGEKKPV